MSTRLEQHFDAVIAKFPDLYGWRVRLAQIARAARIMDKYQEHTDEWLVADDALAVNINDVRKIVGGREEEKITAAIIALVREERSQFQKEN